MALTDIGMIAWPPWATQAANVGALPMLLDAASEKAAMILEAPKTGNIRKIHFATGTVTTGATMDVRIETVDAATGYPTGTLWATNTNVSHVINNTDDNVWLTTAALTSDAAVTQRDLLAVVIVNPAVSAGNLNIQAYSHWQSGRPYTALYTTSWAKSATTPAILLEYSDGTYGKIIASDAAMNSTNAGSTSATLYRGIEITLPFRGRAIGCWAHMRRQTASGTWTWKLYAADGTTSLATMTMDTDQFARDNPDNRMLLFPAAVTLEANTKYWLAGTSDGTSNLTIYYQVYTSAALRNATAPVGAAVSWSQATSPTGTGDWANTATRIPAMGLIFDQIDLGSGVSANLMGGVFQ
jgi:hypothetical protein